MKAQNKILKILLNISKECQLKMMKALILDEKDVVKGCFQKKVLKHTDTEMF